MFDSDQQKMISKRISGFPKKTFLMVSQLLFQGNSFLNCFNAETKTEYIDMVTESLNRLQLLTEPIRLQSQQSSRSELIKALQSMRGISLIVAATIAVELGGFTTLKHQENLWRSLVSSLLSMQTGLK